MKSSQEPITRVLLANGWTQQRLARALGVSQPMISAVVNGKGKLSPRIARKVVELTKGAVTLEELLFGNKPRARRGRAA